MDSDAKAERMEEALHRIADWADAYPSECFPEPDWKRAHEVLQAHGLSLGAISGGVLRRALSGIGKIARGGIVGCMTQ